MCTLIQLIIHNMHFVKVNGLNENAFYMDLIDLHSSNVLSGIDAVLWELYIYITKTVVFRAIDFSHIEEKSNCRIIVTTIP